MSRLRTIASIAAFLVVIAAPRAGACSCAGGRPPLKEMAQRDAVFTGKVLKLTKLGVEPNFFTGYNVTIELARVIKRDKLLPATGSTLVVHTGSGFGDCGYEF